MSSTNRGHAVVEDEFYTTPGWCVEEILPHVPRPRRVVDLGCGAGAIGAVVRERWGTRGQRVEIIGVEKNEDRAQAAGGMLAPVGAYDDVVIADVVDLGFRLRGFDDDFADLVIFNPPFSLAGAFLGVALRLAGPGGTVAMLQRESWAVPHERASVAPHDLARLRSRPSFGKFTRPCKACDGKGWITVESHDPSSVTCKPCKGKGTKTTSNDSASYGWHLFGPGRGGRFFFLEGRPPPKPREKKAQISLAAPCA